MILKSKMTFEIMRLLIKIKYILFVILCCINFFNKQSVHAASDNVPNNFVQSWGNDGPVTGRLQNGLIVFDNYPTSLNIQVGPDYDFGMYYNVEVIVSSKISATQQRSISCVGYSPFTRSTVTNNFNFRYSSSETNYSLLSDSSYVFGDAFISIPMFVFGSTRYSCSASDLDIIKTWAQDQSVTKDTSFFEKWPDTQLVTWQPDSRHDGRACAGSYPNNTFWPICNIRSLYDCDDDPFGSGDWKWNSNLSISLGSIDPNKVVSVKFIDRILAFNEADIDNCRADQGPHLATRERGVNLVGQCTPNWQCEQPLNNYENDTCGNRRISVACNPCPAYSAPGNLSPSGSITPGMRNITWTFTGGANLAYLRISDDNDGHVWDGTCPYNSGGTTGDVCMDGYASSSYSYNFQTGHSYSIWVHQALSGCSMSQLASVSVTVPNRLPVNCSINASQCGTVYGSASDPDGGNMKVVLFHDGKPLTTIPSNPISTLNSYSVTFNALADSTWHTVTARMYDAQETDKYIECSNNYFKYNTANYSNRCDVYYTMTVNGASMPWGAFSENDYGYLNGSCSTVPDSLGYSYHSGDCTSSNLNWQARVKGIMEKASGQVTLAVTGHKDNYKVNFTGPCNTPSFSSTPGEQLFTQTKTYDCSIPEGIELVPDSIEFSEVNDNLYNSENTQAYIRCTKTDEKVDITSNDVVVDKNDLEVCINVDYLGNSAPYKNYELTSNQLFSRCEGNVDFTITDFVYNNEHWGEMNGSLNVVYQPAADNTSEKFEYSGDVIVDPPPGFEEFVFPSF